MKYFWFIVSFLFLCDVQAQESQSSVLFHVMFQNEVIQLDKNYYSTALGDSVQFNNLKFYISNILLIQGKDEVKSIENKYHLIDVSEPGSLSIPLNVVSGLTFNKIRFNIGIDSATNVAGAMGGALDPTNGMYWTWQSGYINFKLEGISKRCPARNNVFQFHIGGYQHPYNTLQSISLDVNANTPIIIDVSIDQILDQMIIKEAFEIMSPNEAAMDFSKVYSTIFKSRA